MALLRGNRGSRAAAARRSARERGRAVRPARVVALALGFLMLTSGPASADGLVAFGSWIYPAIDYLKTRGLVPLWAGIVRPMTLDDVRVAVAEAVRRARAVPLTAYDRALLDRLAREVGFAGGGLTAVAGTAYSQFGLSVPYVGLSGGGPTTGWMLGARGDGSLRLNAASLAFRTGSISWLVGRAPTGWGPQLGGLFFSEYAGGLDQVRASFQWRGLRFTRVVGWLDGGRSLVATRIDLVSNPRLRLGVSDVVIMPGPPYWLYVLNPLSLGGNTAISWKIHEKLTGIHDNTMMGADVDWLLRPGFRLFGEFLLDDLTVPKGGVYYPSKWGLMVGADVQHAIDGWDALLQYAVVPNWTYTGTAATTYVLRGLPLGYPLGADFDVLHLRLTRRGGSGPISVWISFIRKGEGRIGDIPGNQSDAWAGYFLKGVVERSVIVGVMFSGTLHGWDYTLDPWVARRTNAQHVLGVTQTGWGIALQASQRF